MSLETLVGERTYAEAATMITIAGNENGWGARRNALQASGDPQYDELREIERNFLLQSHSSDEPLSSEDEQTLLRYEQILGGDKALSENTYGQAISTFQDAWNHTPLGARRDKLRESRDPRFDQLSAIERDIMFGSHRPEKPMSDEDAAKLRRYQKLLAPSLGERISGMTSAIGRKLRSFAGLATSQETAAM
jgi:hypothetical protein